MLAVPEAATREQDGQIAVVVTAAVHVRTKQDHSVVEQVGIAFLCCFQSGQEIAEANAGRQSGGAGT